MFEAFPLTVNPWLPVGVLWSTFLLIPESQLPPATRLPVPNPARIELLGWTAPRACGDASPYPFLTLLADWVPGLRENSRPYLPGEIIPDDFHLSRCYSRHQEKRTTIYN